jgi:hypothetical protein
MAKIQLFAPTALYRIGEYTLCKFILYIFKGTAFHKNNLFLKDK